MMDKKNHKINIYHTIFEDCSKSIEQWNLNCN